MAKKYYSFGNFNIVTNLNLLMPQVIVLGLYFISFSKKVLSDQVCITSPFDME